MCELLQEADFILPILVHLSALVSVTAVTGKQGTNAGAQANVNSSVDIGDFIYTESSIATLKRMVVEPISKK